MTRIWRKPLVVAGAFATAVLIPFVITALKLRTPRPYVVLDLAQTELRVRSVFSSHPPLIGLPGRLGEFGVHTGSHPGPISFWVLAPFYKLFGSDPWALFAAALSVNFLVICVALWLGWRIGRLPILIGVGSVALLLVHTFGIIVVEQPWNPYLPLMAWMVVLLAAWAVLADDIKMLPVLVASATWCMQTHIPYLGMGAGVVGGTVLFTVFRRMLRSRMERSGTAEPGARKLEWLTGTSADWPSVRRLVGWIGASVALGVLMWIPPIYQQLKWGSEGNLAMLWKDLSHPPEAAGGLSQGVHLVLAHLNVAQLITGHDLRFVVINPNWPGVLMLIVWMVSVVVAWRHRVRLLVILDALIAGCLVLAVVALSKIYGDLYWYLMMWMWTIAAAMFASIIWSGIALVQHLDLAEKTRLAVRRGSLGVLVVSLVGLFIALNVDAARAQIPDRMLSDQMGHVMPETIAAIRAGRTPGDTGEGRYLVTWFDPVKIGSGGYTVLDELDAHGIPAGLGPSFWGIVPKRDVIPDGTERGVVHLSVGDTDIARWRAKPDAIEVAYYDGRSAAEKREFARLRSKARRLIREAGADPDVVDKSLTGASLNTALPLEATQAMSRMADIGLPVAIFLAPPVG